MYDEAINDPVYGEKWRAACFDDFTGKNTNLGLWELVKDLPPGRKAINGKWIFSVKLKPDKSIEKFKARYIGCGYSQIAGIDYNLLHPSPGVSARFLRRRVRCR
jgi:hypothetical protein